MLCLVFGKMTVAPSWSDVSKRSWCDRPRSLAMSCIWSVWRWWVGYCLDWVGLESGCGVVATPQSRWVWLFGVCAAWLSVRAAVALGSPPVRLALLVVCGGMGGCLDGSVCVSWSEEGTDPSHSDSATERVRWLRQSSQLRCLLAAWLAAMITSQPSVRWLVNMTVSHVINDSISTFNRESTDCSDSVGQSPNRLGFVLDLFGMVIF